MGRRVFELVATKGQMQYQHYIILLDDNIGALEILPRSITVRSPVKRDPSS